MPSLFFPLFDPNKIVFWPLFCIRFPVDVVIAVSPSPNEQGYEIDVVVKADVPPFEPAIPASGTIGKDAAAREFLLHKCKQ